jgi:hypothetical protein
MKLNPLSQATIVSGRIEHIQLQLLFESCLHGWQVWVFKGARNGGFCDIDYIIGKYPVSLR